MKTVAGARLLAIARIRAGRDWRTAPKEHAYHQWLLVCRGRSFVRMSGRDYEARAGQCLFFRQGRIHEEWTDSKAPHESFGMCFAWPCLPRDMPVCVSDAHGRMRVLAQWLTDEWGRHEPDSSILRRQYFQCLLIEWLRLAADRQDPLVARIRAHIRANIGKSLALDDLARVAGLSRSHFSRQYKEKAGRTLSDDLRALRLEHAQGLLMTSDTPIKDVATLSGLTDQHYMSRLFRVHLNVTPGELRSTARAQRKPGE